MKVGGQWSFSSAPPCRGSVSPQPCPVALPPSPSSVSATKSATKEPAAGYDLHTARHMPGVEGCLGGCAVGEKGKPRDVLMLSLACSWKFSSEHLSWLWFHLVLLILAPATEATCSGCSQRLCGPGHGEAALSSVPRLSQLLPLLPWLWLNTLCS